MARNQIYVQPEYMYIGKNSHFHSRTEAGQRLPASVGDDVRFIDLAGYRGPAVTDHLRALDKFVSHGGLLQREEIEEILEEDVLSP